MYSARLVRHLAGSMGLSGTLKTGRSAAPGRSLSAPAEVMRRGAKCDEYCKFDDDFI